MGEEMRPLVTVIMPVYNGAETLQSAVQSVLVQGYEPMQFIAVDDGSTDASLERLASFGSAIEVYRQSRKGPAEARNLALSHTRGSYVAFIDADDVWLPGKLQLQVAYLDAHPEVSAVFGRFERWEAGPQGDFQTPPLHGMPVDHREAPTKERFRTTALTGCLYADLLLDSAVHIITAMVRREAASAIGGFDASLATGSDYDFWLRFSRANRMTQLDQVMAWYRIHPHSITKRPRIENAEYSILVRTLAEHGPKGPDDREVAPALIAQRLFDIAFGHGYLLFWQGHWDMARPSFHQAWVHRPWYPKVWVYGLLTVIWSQPPAWFATIICRKIQRPT
jgi:glycosyltransferase involved in cell wall biosynthesis